MTRKEELVILVSWAINKIADISSRARNDAEAPQRRAGAEIDRANANLQEYLIELNELEL